MPKAKSNKRHKVALKIHLKNGVDLEYKNKSRTPQDFYYQIFHRSKDIILLFNKEGFVLDINNAFTQITGYKKERMIGQHMFNLPFINKKAINVQNFADLTLGKEVKPFEVEFVHKDGHVCHVEVNASGINDGTQFYGQAIIRDITDRKQLEETYRSIFEHTGTATVIINEDSTINFVNSEFEKLSGLSKKEVFQHKNWYAFFDKKELPRMKKFHLLRRKKADSAPRNYETVFIDKNGDRKPVFMTVGMIPNTKLSVASLLDISDLKKTENALKDSKKLFDDLVAGNPTPIFVVNMNHQVVYWNKAMEKITGIKAKKIIGTTNHWKAFYSKKTEMITDLLIEGKKPSQILNLNRYKKFQVAKDKHKNGVTGSMLFEDFNGKRKWLKFVIKPLFDAHSNMVGAIETLEDITEEKVIKESLKNRIRELETLYKVTAAQKMLVPTQKVLKQIVKDLVIACDEVRPARASINLDGSTYTNLKKGESFVSKISETIQIQGRERGSIELGYIEPIEDADSYSLQHEKKVMSVVVSNLSRHINHREVVRRYQKVIHKSVVGILIIQSGIIRYANPRLSRLLKLRNGQILGSSFESFIALNSQKFKSKKTTKRSQKLKIRRSDASIIDVECYVQNIEFLGKEAILVTLQDITKIEKARQREQHFNQELKHKIAEKTKDLRRANKRLQSINKLKDDFIAIASHELRSPLTSARGYLSFLMEDPELFNPETLMHLNRAYNSIIRLNHLVNNMLDVSRLETKNIKLDKHPVALDKLIESVINGLDFQAKSKGIHIQFENHLSDKNAKLMVDPARMNQVIRNILENAIRYSPEQKIIHVFLEQKKNKIQIKITDHGIGIAESERKKIFNKFKQVNSEILRHHSGSGLGLYIAKEIVKLHDGKIWCESTLKKGSTFIVELPINS